MRSDDRTTESTAVTVRDNNNQELVDLLTLGEGPLAAGAQPAIQAANDAGRAALAQSLQNDETTVAVKKKKEKGEQAEKAEPMTIQEYHPQYVMKWFKTPKLQNYKR